MKRFDGVLDGGGVRGVAHLGALSALEAEGWVMHRTLGTSAGSIVGSLAAAGYGVDEMIDTLPEIVPDDGRPGWLRPSMVARSAADLLRYGGLASGEGLERFMRDKLSAKGVTTFGDLRIDGETDPRLAYRIQVVVSDLTGRRPLVLPAEASDLGLDPDELDVARMVRASSAVPFVFRPVTLDAPADGSTRVLVDGGVLSSFPVNWFVVAGSALPSIGFDLHAAEAVKRSGRTEAPARNPFGIAYRIAHSLTEARDVGRADPTARRRTIALDVGHVRPAGPADPDDLIERGRASAKEWLASQADLPATGTDG